MKIFLVFAALTVAVLLLAADEKPPAFETGNKARAKLLTTTVNQHFNTLGDSGARAERYHVRNSQD